MSEAGAKSESESVVRMCFTSTLLNSTNLNAKMLNAKMLNHQFEVWFANLLKCSMFEEVTTALREGDSPGGQAHRPCLCVFWK